jgi:hypothetical protein
MLYMTSMLRLVALTIMARNTVLAAPDQDVRDVDAEAPVYVYYIILIRQFVGG